MLWVEVLLKCSLNGGQKMLIVPYYHKGPADDWQASITTTERHDNNINLPLRHVHVAPSSSATQTPRGLSF